LLVLVWLALALALEVLVSLPALVQAVQMLVPQLEWSYLEQPSLA
jgi:hypothetical protein